MPGCQISLSSSCSNCVPSCGSFSPDALFSSTAGNIGVPLSPSSVPFKRIFAIYWFYDTLAGPSIPLVFSNLIVIFILSLILFFLSCKFHLTHMAQIQGFACLFFFFLRGLQMSRFLFFKLVFFLLGLLAFSGPASPQEALYPLHLLRCLEAFGLLYDSTII